MRHRFILLTALCAAFCSPAAAQSLKECSASEIYFTGDQRFAFISLLLDAPPDEATSSKERLDLLMIQTDRDNDFSMAESAMADSNHLSMDIFDSIFHVDMDKTPFAWNLSLHLCQEAAQVSGALKNVYNRPRPYEKEPNLHPICEHNVAIIGSSYPSGHAISGYLEAFALADLLPERRDEILERAKKFARNREVCGVHYPSDIDAGKKVAYKLYKRLLDAPTFQQEFHCASLEITNRKTNSTAQESAASCMLR